MIVNSKTLIRFVTAAFVFLSFFIVSQKLAGSVYARTGTNSNASGQVLTYSVEDHVGPREMMTWEARIINDSDNTYNTTLSALIPADVGNVTPLDGAAWYQVGDRYYLDVSLAPRSQMVARWRGQGQDWEAYRATSDIYTNDSSMATSTYVVFYAGLSFVVKNQSSSDAEVWIQVYDRNGVLAGSTGTGYPLKPGNSEFPFLRDAINCDLNPYTIKWSTDNISWKSTGVSVNPINVINNQMVQVTITVTDLVVITPTSPPPTPSPGITITPTPTPEPGVTPPVVKTASLSSSCPSGAPTLSAVWNVGVGNDCSAYIYAGGTPHVISTSCNSSWTGSKFPDDTALVDGGIYHFYVGDPDGGTTNGGEATISCAGPGPTPSPGARPCDWCTNADTCPDSGWTFYDDVWDYCAAERDGLCCPSNPVPTPGSDCNELKWGCDAIGDCSREFHVGTCENTDAPVNECFKNCEWLGSPLKCSQNAYDFCYCEPKCDTDWTSMIFDPVAPEPGQRLNIKVQAYRGYMDVGLTATHSSGRPVSLIWDGISGSDPIQWQWHVPSVFEGTYTFQFKISYGTSCETNCGTSSSLTVVAQGNVTGKVYEDEGNNCTGMTPLTSSNLPIAKAILNTSPPREDEVDSLGQYLIRAPRGTYSIRPSKLDWVPSTGGGCNLNPVKIDADTTVTRNLYLRPPIAWYQSQGGDLHTQGNISSLIPSTASNKNFSIDTFSYPGVISWGGTNANIGPSGSISSRKWWANSSYLPSKYSYDYFYKKLGAPTIDNFSCNSACPNLNDALYLGKTTIFYSADNVQIDGNNSWAIPANTKAIVLVNGDLILSLNPNNQRITVPVGSFLGFFVKGNIKIDGGMGNKQTGYGIEPFLQGVYFADGVIDTYASDLRGEGSGRRLIGAGVFYAKGGVLLKRDLKRDPNPLVMQNSNTPAELFIFRPDLIMNSPRQLWTGSLNWVEVAP